MIDISSKLRELRKSHGHTIQTVADSIGIAVRTYQNYEYGQREISADALCKLSNFYGVTTDYLLGRETGEASALDALAAEFNMSALEKKIADNYLALPKSMRGDLMKFLREAVEEVQSESGD